MTALGRAVQRIVRPIIRPWLASMAREQERRELEVKRFEEGRQAALDALKWELLLVIEQARERDRAEHHDNDQHAE